MEGERRTLKQQEDGRIADVVEKRQRKAEQADMQMTVAQEETQSLQVIARMHSLFPAKFGIPRQSGLAEAVKSTVVFEPAYRAAEAVRGLEGFSHLWLIWQFSQAVRDEWMPTVRPPRLGGNRRMGVFATRSPFRPNAIGLSAVRLEKIEFQQNLGPVLHVAGADLMDRTPIYDIKPYLPYADSYPDASCGFSQPLQGHCLQVEFPQRWRNLLPPALCEALVQILEQDPRPAYHSDSQRVYGFVFADWNVRFAVSGSVLTVCSIEPVSGEEAPRW